MVSLGAAGRAAPGRFFVRQKPMPGRLACQARPSSMKMRNEISSLEVLSFAGNHGEEEKCSVPAPVQAWKEGRKVPPGEDDARRAQGTCPQGRSGQVDKVEGTMTENIPAGSIEYCKCGHARAEHAKGGKCGGLGKGFRLRGGEFTWTSAKDHCDCENFEVEPREFWVSARCDDGAVITNPIPIVATSEDEARRKAEADPYFEEQANGRTWEVIAVNTREQQQLLMSTKMSTK